jgi:AcrR family transcriptional regulator
VATTAAEQPLPDADRREGKGDRTRRRLLDHAIARFAADGYRRTSVSDIARDAGLTPAGAYAYFAGKEALFVAAVDDDAGSLIDRARDARERASSVIDRLLAGIGALADGLDAHPLARRVLGGQEPEVVARLLELPSLGALRADIAEELRGAQAHGEVRRDIDAEDLALGIETIVLTLLMGIVQAGPPEEARQRGVTALLRAALS